MIAFMLRMLAWYDIKTTTIRSGVGKYGQKKMSDGPPDSEIEKFCAELGLMNPSTNGSHLLKDQELMTTQSCLWAYRREL